MRSLTTKRGGQPAARRAVDAERHPLELMERIALRASILVAALLPGCAATQFPSFTVSVSCLATPTASAAASFVIFPGDPNVAASDLQFQEYSRIVERALSQRGFHRALSVDEADMMIILAYGIDAPKEHVASTSTPQFGPTGVASSTTHGSIHGNSYSGATDYSPAYGVTGYRSRVRTYVTFARHVFIEAVDLPTFRSQHEIAPLWRAGIASVGPSGDLRRVFPVMIGAATAYLGADTGGILTVRLNEDDPRVMLAKGIAIEPMTR